MLVGICVLTCILTFVGCDTFTSMADMEAIVKAESETEKFWRTYIDQELDRIKKIQALSKVYLEELSSCKAEGEDCFANPVTAYLFVKRLEANHTNLLNLLDNDSLVNALLQNTTDVRNSQNVTFPQPTDIENAGLALLRLQDTYNISTDTMGNGTIANTWSDMRLSAKDCFDLGAAAQKNNDHYHAIIWMQKALDLISNNASNDVKIEEVLEFLAFSLYQQGNVQRALKMSRQLLDLDPKNLRVQANVKFYKDSLKDKNETETNEALPELVNNQTILAKSRHQYDSLCQGNVNTAQKKTARMHCYYKKDSAFLTLAPLKVEIAHLRPKILIFKNIVSEAEIETLKNLGKPKLKRAPVVDGKKVILSEFRTSKNAWLEAKAHETVQRMNNRLKDMTNLNMAAAELLQVANYGLGGYYDAHYDFATKEQIQRFGYHGFYQPEWGNRIATVLIYMSTPYAGGATIFPELNISVSSSKHDAVFWFNLKPNGLADESTLHAACPVLAGTKWVLNKWLHERGQEFTRRCGLRENFYE